MSDFAPCPCGQTPKRLVTSLGGQGYKWANVCGDCCGEWSVEFNTRYKDISTPECMEFAIDAWNKATRAPQLHAVTP